MSESPDKQFIACNYAEAVSVASEGALAYFCNGWTGGSYERVQVLVRSRGHRWIKKWEPIKRLKNFRFKTIPPEHPRYADDRIIEWDEAVLERLQKNCEWHKAAARGTACNHIRGVQ